MCIHVYLKTFPCMHEHSCVSHQILRNHMAFAPTYVSIWACILACSQGPNRMQPLLCTWAISPHKRQAPLSPHSLPPLSPPESASVAPSLPPIRPHMSSVVWCDFPFLPLLNYNPALIPRILHFLRSLTTWASSEVFRHSILFPIPDCCTRWPAPASRVLIPSCFFSDFSQWGMLHLRKVFPISRGRWIPRQYKQAAFISAFTSI